MESSVRTHWSDSEMCHDLGGTHEESRALVLAANNGTDLLSNLVKSRSPRVETFRADQGPYQFDEVFSRRQQAGGFIQ
ncbi:hypothetical protein [Rhizobium phaseoli]|uniref:hypothetical protein n=1 Tax=Rhizobium phaseoli TaxID=396 RepID=UPI0016745FA5|nr:hypothetical protein [Rhizobium phaseoli]